MSHAVLYLLGSIQDPLPWATCRGLNTTTCYVLEAGGPQPCRQVHRALALRVEAAVERDRRPGIPVVIGDRVVLVPRHQFARNCTAATVSAVEHFHRDFVLHLSNHLDVLHLNTDVALACAATWAIACVASCSRIGRISALMYALVIVRVFLVWFLCAKVVGVGFKGDLWKQLSSFDPAQLLDLESWRLATERSLYSMGCSRSFLRLAGWNRFFSDARCVAPILAWTNFATTLMSTTMVFLLLFLVSERTDTNLDAYFEPEEAPFVSVVQALLFPGARAVLLRPLLQPDVPHGYLRPAFAERTVLAKVALCLFIYTLSLPLCSEVGPYLVNMLDINFKGTLYLLVNLAEVLVVIRVYGSVDHLVDLNGSEVRWSFIEELQKLQPDEGLHLGNRLTRAHIEWAKQKMKVRLAVQTLSSSVADALDFCESTLKLPQFKGAHATAEFIRMFDRLFDVLNSRNPFGRSYKAALRKANEASMRTFFEKAELYITKPKDAKEKPVIESLKKTGFVGLLICMRSVTALFDRLVATGKLQYLLTHKMSQDHLETFFGCVRGKGGYNNNPTACQFTAAYKRLLIRTEVASSEAENCSRDIVTVLCPSSDVSLVESPTSLASLRRSSLLQPPDDDNDCTQRVDFPTSLSPVVGAIVPYIAGFVAR
ncbi:hypothetical protein MRX96_006247 [Rhipicephalus microplus]